MSGIQQESKVFFLCEFASHHYKILNYYYYYYFEIGHGCNRVHQVFARQQPLSSNLANVNAALMVLQVLYAVGEEASLSFACL